jgi:hypothetical protein
MFPPILLNILLQSGLSMTYDEKQETLVKLIGMIFILIVICLVVLVAVLLIKNRKKKKTTVDVSETPIEESKITQTVDNKSTVEAMSLDSKSKITEEKQTEKTVEETPKIKPTSPPIIPTPEKVEVKEDIRLEEKKIIEKPNPLNESEKEDKLAQLRKRIEELKKEKEESASKVQKVENPEAKTEAPVKAPEQPLEEPKQEVFENKKNTTTANSEQVDKLDMLKKRIEELKQEKEQKANEKIQEEYSAEKAEDEKTELDDTQIIKEEVAKPFEIALEENSPIEEIEEKEEAVDNKESIVEEKLETIKFLPKTVNPTNENPNTNYPVPLRTFTEWLDAFKIKQGEGEN